MDISSDFNKNVGQATFELSAYEPSQLGASDKPEIVFSGKSNVGKSSMINRLISRKSLARVSSAPGKTVSVNFYNCGLFRLVDLPGYGYAKVSKRDQESWAKLIGGFFDGQRNIALVVQLIDARREPSEGDRQMLSYLKQCHLPFIVAFTKSDKLKSTQLTMRRGEVLSELAICGANSLSEENIIFTSAETSLGMDELKQQILNACTKNEEISSDE